MNSQVVADAGEILTVALALVIAVPTIVATHRAMERPRLRIVETPDGCRTTRRDALQYAAAIVFLLLLCWTLLAGILVITASRLYAWR